MFAPRASDTRVHPMGSAWTFRRGDERLSLERREFDGQFELAVNGSGGPRVYGFRDSAELDRFQQDMETFLLKTGWAFERFSPDRRGGTDRRTFPRIDVDRRRWWTDGLKMLPLPKWNPEARRRRGKQPAGE